jgi:hypothetical protein
VPFRDAKTVPDAQAARQASNQKSRILGNESKQLEEAAEAKRKLNKSRAKIAISDSNGQAEIDCVTRCARPRNLDCSAARPQG